MIPFHTLSQRHLVYAYLAVFILQFGYALWLAVQWKKDGVRFYPDSVDPRNHVRPAAQWLPRRFL